LNALISAVQGSVVLDQGWDVLSFAQQLHGLSSGAIGFVTIPVESLSLPTPYDGDAVKVDPERVLQFVQQVVTTPVVSASGPHNSGVHPVAATSRSTPTSTPTPPPTDMTTPPVTAATGCVD
jgi:hypothetical protein